MIGQLFLRSVICASVIAAVHHLSACLHLQMDCSVARIVAISCGVCWVVACWDWRLSRLEI